jgi:hypothetical protein
MPLTHRCSQGGVHLETHIEITHHVLSKDSDLLLLLRSSVYCMLLMTHGTFVTKCLK